MNNVIEKQTAEHYKWGDQCESWILLNSIGLSVKQEQMPTGTKEKLHFHKQAQQFFFILKGTATFYLNNEKVVVAEQKGLYIQPMTNHLISNEANEILEFLVISQPSTTDDRTTI